MGDNGYDYEVLGECEFGVPTESYDVTGCGEPAQYRVWWRDDKSDAMLVCQKHFEFIEKAEKEMGGA